MARLTWLDRTIETARTSRSAATEGAGRPGTGTALQGQSAARA